MGFRFLRLVAVRNMTLPSVIASAATVIIILTLLLQLALLPWMQPSSTPIGYGWHTVIYSNNNTRVSKREARPVCDRCGSSNVIKKGYRRNKGYKKQKWQCNDCGHWPSDNGSKLLTKEQKVACADAYYHSIVNLEEMATNVELLTLDELSSRFGLSTAALSRNIRKIVKSMEEGLETTRKKIDQLGRFLIIDSKHVWIKRHKCYCWIAVDSLKGEPVHFALANSKEKAAVRQFLYQLKIMGGYKARAIVADLEESIHAEAEVVFTDEITGAKPLLQADTVHRLRQIAKRWPYLKWKGRPKISKRDREPRTADISASEQKAIEKRKISPEKAKLRIEFSELACKLIHASTIQQKKELECHMRSRVEEWSADEIIMEEYHSLMSNLHLYHSRDELGACPSTSNIAETLNGILKKKLSRMQGFKTFESGQIHLKGFWQTYRVRHFCVDGASILTDIASSTVFPRANKTVTAGSNSKSNSLSEQPVPALLPLPMLPPPPPSLPLVSGRRPPPLPSIEDPEINASLITPTMTVSKHEDERFIADPLVNYDFPVWLDKSKLSNPDAIAFLLYDLREHCFTTGQIANMLSKCWKKIDVRNVSREITTAGKDLKKYTARQKVTFKNGRTGFGNKLYLIPEGHKWFEAERLSSLRKTGQSAA